MLPQAIALQQAARHLVGVIMPQHLLFRRDLGLVRVPRSLGVDGALTRLGVKGNHHHLSNVGVDCLAELLVAQRVRQVSTWQAWKLPARPRRV